MRDTRQNQPPRSDSSSPEREIEQNSRDDGPDDSRTAQQPQLQSGSGHQVISPTNTGSRTLNTQPPPLVPAPQRQHNQNPQLQAQLQFQQQTQHQAGIPRHIGVSTLVATQGGRFVGGILLNNPIDLHNIQTPPGTFVHIPATLVLDARNLGPSPGPRQNPQPLPHSQYHQQPQSSPQNRTAPTTAGSVANSNDQTSRKRLAPVANITPPDKRQKVVDPNVAAIPPRPVSDYARAIEEPTDMSKNEDGSCLTCVRYRRKCKGTSLKLVKGAKRCEQCAKPGTNTSGRVCFWKVPSKGVHTYEDAQRILGRNMGGRTIQQNTRQGRLKRQKKAEAEASQVVPPTPENKSDGGRSDVEMVDPHAGTPADDDIDHDGDGGLSSAAESARQSLYDVVAADLGLPETNHSDATRLAVERVIRDALNGRGRHREHVEGIDDRVVEAMLTQVQATIAALEAAESEEGTEVEE